MHLIYIVKTNNKTESLGPLNAGSTVHDKRFIFVCSCHYWGTIIKKTGFQTFKCIYIYIYTYIYIFQIYMFYVLTSNECFT